MMRWLFIAMLFAGAALSAAPAAIGAGASPHEDPAQLLQHADTIKSARNDEFIRLLQSLDADSAELTPSQALYLRYLKGWQAGYKGEFASGISQLDAVASESNDPTLRFRASASVINMLAIASRNADAYSRMNQVLDLLPRVTDIGAREQGLLIFAQLYDEAGQYDLGLQYAEKALAENWSDATDCKAVQLKLGALYKLGRLHANSDDFQQGMNVCIKANEPLFTNLIRIDAANLDISEGKPLDAISLLQAAYEEAKGTHYSRLISAVEGTLAKAYWKAGNAMEAQQYAERAVASAIPNQFTEPLIDAYEVLYQTASRQGDYQAALGYHEKFATADKGYLNLTSARILAYQMVHQQVQEKKLQVEALSKQNQVLQLKQAVGRKNMIAIQLGVALLLVVLGSIGMYAYRTKRSQLKFQKLARRDGLTEIYNRQYFVEASEQELEYCRKSVRDVSVVAIDLDHFKQINDTHGHAAGDFALKRAVAACQKHLRSVDVFGRLGGEEFGILMPDCVPERAIDLAEKMRQSIADMAGTEGEPGFEIRASFGVTAARWSGYDLLQLLAQADSALYQAKREGRNRVVAIAGPAAANSEPPPSVTDRRKA